MSKKDALTMNAVLKDMQKAMEGFRNDDMDINTLKAELDWTKVSTGAAINKAKLGLKNRVGEDDLSVY